MTDAPSKLPPVSVIGLGSMGSALAGALLSAGYPVTVWNRTADKADDLVARGAHRTADVTDAIRASDLVIVCLVDCTAARDVLGRAANAVAGRVIVNLTNGVPSDARDQAAWAQMHHARYIDGGIMAVPQTIGSADAFIFYSGDDGAFREHEPALSVLGRPRWLGTDPGLAPLYDLALLSGLYGLYAGSQHAVTLVDSAGGDAAAFVRDLLVPWMMSMVPFTVAEANPQGRVPDEFNPAMQVASISNVLAAGTAQGLRTELTGHLLASLDLMTRAAAANRPAA